MENNFFTKEQLNIVFSDKGFVEFFSNYFSTFANDDILSKMDLMEGEIDELWRLYIRLFLSNIDPAINSISMILKNMSFAQEEQRRNISGGIKGRLLINEYVQNKSMVKIPREYHCVVKTKGVETPENNYFTHIVLNVLEKLRKLMNLYVLYLGDTNSTEYKKMRDIASFFSSILRKQPAASIIAKKGLKVVIGDPTDPQMTELQYRFVKNKVRNAYEYRRLFDWYEKYKNGSVQWILDDGLNMLIYDDEFRNKLFELWNLYRISKTLCTDYELILIGENPVAVQMDSWIYEYKSRDNKSIVHVYYQKGRGIYWNDEYSQNWYYLDASGKSKSLRGIPDITVTIDRDGENRIILIDLKNRVRNAGENAEEIYKIIGYYSNFKKYLCATYPDASKRKAILIFRNDNRPFDEKLVSDTGESILAFSTSPETDYILSDLQFKKICNELFA